MKNLKNLLIILFLLFCLCSCKNSSKEKGIEEAYMVEEIEELSSASRIKDAIEDPAFLDTLYKSEQVIEFYKFNDYEPVWNKRKYRETLFSNIQNIEEEGLFYEDYHGDEIQKTLSKLNSNNTDENTKLEILLTDAFLRLTEDLATGKLDPRKLYEIWGTPVNSFDPLQVLKDAVASGNFQKEINRVRPDGHIYNGLKKSLEEFKRSGINEEYSTHVNEGDLIKPGKKDPRISSITFRLKELGFYKTPVDSSNIIYDENLVQAVKNYQKSFGLQNDGIIGNSTIKSLNLTRRDRYHQLLVNLERWRWYPRDLGDHYILINIPRYKLNLVRDGDTIRSHKVMVGTEARKTPVFSDKIQYVVYNPTWTIPPTIKKNDVIPGAARDISYLKKKNLHVYDPQGNQIDPETINWNSSKASAYTFRQNAGPSNPLGLVKIIYPNEYMIYLHDTPSKDLFEKNLRAQSSGCVRVQNALDLAEYLLKDQRKYDHEKIEEIINSGKTTQIPVEMDVTVHHFYWTAFRENDSTRFIHDIYGLDQPLWEHLKPKSL